MREKAIQILAGHLIIKPFLFLSNHPNQLLDAFMENIIWTSLVHCVLSGKKTLFFFHAFKLSAVYSTYYSLHSTMNDDLEMFPSLSTLRHYFINEMHKIPLAWPCCIELMCSWVVAMINTERENPATKSGGLSTWDWNCVYSTFLSSPATCVCVSQFLRWRCSVRSWFKLLKIMKYFFIVSFLILDPADWSDELQRIFLLQGNTSKSASGSQHSVFPRLTRAGPTPHCWMSSPLSRTMRSVRFSAG